jgi:hypothetical protein
VGDGIDGFGEFVGRWILLASKKSAISGTSNPVGNIKFFRHFEFRTHLL